MIEKHMTSYQNYVMDAILGIEASSVARLYGWESEMMHAIKAEQELSQESIAFMEYPTYGDGGMAAAVRIASLHDRGPWKKDDLEQMSNAEI